MEYPNTFQSTIFKRALSEKEFSSICDSYNRAKIRMSSKEPTDKQYAIAEYAKKHGYVEAGKKFKIQTANVYYCVEKVGRYIYMTK